MSAAPGPRTPSDVPGTGRQAAALPGEHGAPATAASERVRLLRRRERGSYDRAVIDAILDEALIAHLGIVDQDGQPLVIPTLHARCGDVVYLHGSAAGRTLRALADGAPMCLTVSLVDGLVLARSAMHHSANYRSVVLLGKAWVLEDPAEKRAALQAIVEHIVPGRWPDIRPPNESELKATAVLAMRIEEASAKARTGPPVEDEEDYALPAWAGVIPLCMQTGTPQADPRLADGIAAPAYARAYVRPSVRSNEAR
jgi:nitroimidazol reductase NimA-like FMN-containing flavoprotein (pyridoxamine 5'-phosphate oxidase superfamily)